MALDLLPISGWLSLYGLQVTGTVMSAGPPKRQHPRALSLPHPQRRSCLGLRLSQKPLPRLHTGQLSRPILFLQKSVLRYEMLIQRCSECTAQSQLYLCGKTLGGTKWEDLVDLLQSWYYATGVPDLVALCLRRLLRRRLSQSAPVG